MSVESIHTLQICPQQGLANLWRQLSELIMHVSEQLNMRHDQGGASDGSFSGRSSALHYCSPRYFTERISSPDIR